VSEDDEQSAGPPAVAAAAPRVAALRTGEDNSLGRLLTLADGIFAISMTLLSLDLKIPDLGGHPTDAMLRQQLAANSASYLSYLLTFYVVAGYWVRHRRLMRSVVMIHPALIRDTMFLLVLVAAMPFPASLLGQYGSEPTSLAIYGALNALATLTLIVMSWDVRRQQLSDHELSEHEDFAHNWRSWWTCAVFLICIPAGYIVGHRAPYVLILLAIPDWAVWIYRRSQRRRARRADQP
jgi:uncharacterized membrane protein